MDTASTELVFVSGASGFIASHIVQQLLVLGYRVRGSVRDASNKSDYAHLSNLAGAAERLEIVSADLLTPLAFDAHVAGASYVMHTASPYALEAKDPQKDLIDPAVMGTRTMLDACAKSNTVKRVVLTSSMAAITDEPESDHVLTEANWNEKSTLTRNAYYLSKTLAERAAWDFIAAQKPTWDLVAINPFLVIGPAMTKSVNTSNQMFIDMLQGVYPGIMNLTWGFVDVRDVAAAHIQAIRSPAASGRYICAGETLTMRALVLLLQEAGWKGKLPSMGLDCAMGDYAAKLASYMQPKGAGSYLRTHLGRVPRYDNTKIQTDLGIRFRPVKDSVLDTVEDMAKHGHITKN
jgi:dihydroflavonol-4-reductase